MAVPALALLKNADGYEDVVLLSKGVVEIAESQSVCNDAMMLEQGKFKTTVIGTIEPCLYSCNGPRPPE